VHPIKNFVLQIAGILQYQPGENSNDGQCESRHRALNVAICLFELVAAENIALMSVERLLNSDLLKNLFCGLDIDCHLMICKN
jgi:hypothetical protein